MLKLKKVGQGNKKATWVPLKGFETRYLIADNGLILDLPRMRLVPQHTSGGNEKCSYRACYIDGKRKYVHRLICEAFHGSPKPNQVVNHIDGNTMNNVPSNLEWTTQSRNVKLAKYKGRSSKLTKSEVEQAKYLLSAGYSRVAVAQVLNTAYFNIWKLDKGRTFKK